MSVVVEARNRSGLSVAVIFLEILPAALVVMLLAAVGVLHVTSRVLVVKMGYELSRLDAESVELQRENDSLKLELATLKSPSRLEAVARGQLGLVPPSASAVVHVEGPRARPQPPAAPVRVSPPSAAPARTAPKTRDVRGVGVAERDPAGRAPAPRGSGR